MHGTLTCCDDVRARNRKRDAADGGGDALEMRLRAMDTHRGWWTAEAKHSAMLMEWLHNGQPTLPPNNQQRVPALPAACAAASQLVQAPSSAAGGHPASSSAAAAAAAAMTGHTRDQGLPGLAPSMPPKANQNWHELGGGGPVGPTRPHKKTGHRAKAVEPGGGGGGTQSELINSWELGNCGFNF